MVLLALVVGRPSLLLLVAVGLPWLVLALAVESLSLGRVGPFRLFLLLMMPFVLAVGHDVFAQVFHRFGRGDHSRTT